MSRFVRIVSYILLILLVLQNSLSVFAQSTVNITAAVTPSSSAIQNNITSPSGNGPFYQGTEIQYEIAYGQTTSSPQGITIQTTWSQGLFQSGVNSPSVEVLEYVIGSAEQGYNNAIPVVDLVNRTITWTISSFPANTTDEVVRFKLRTTSNYSGQNRATFHVTSNATIVTTTTTDSVTQTYQYNYDPDAYTKSLTPAPTDLPTPTPTPPPNLEFLYVITPEIRSDMAKIELKTNIHTQATIKYGTTPGNLTSQLTSLTPRIFHFFTLDRLEPESDYYFQIEIKDAYRKRPSIISDIFTFTTAKISDAPKVQDNSIIFTSNNSILLDGFTASEKDLKNRIITLPTSTPFEFKFSLADAESVKSILTTIRETSLSQAPVLGLGIAPNPSPNSSFAQIVEIEKGSYMGRLLSLERPGMTDVIVRISDFEGNIIEHKIGTIKTVYPMRIISKKGGRGLENARVELSLYNPTQKIFQKLSPEVIPIPNPSYSDSQGIVNLVLPNGKYQANVSLVRFEDQTIEFAIGSFEGEEYPTIIMNQKPFAFLEQIKYYIGILFDLKELTNIYTRVLSSSNRTYDLLHLFAFTLLGLTILTIFIRTLWTLFASTLYPKYKRLTNAHSTLIQARILDISTRYPIKHAHVYLIDLAKDKIISKSRSNRFGYVTFHMPQPKSFRLSILKEGFEASGFYDFKKDTLSSTATLWMKKYPSKQNGLKKVLGYLIHIISSFLFELALCILVVLELLFVRSYGLGVMKPVLIITLATIVLLGIELLASMRLNKNKDMQV